MDKVYKRIIDAQSMFDKASVLSRLKYKNNKKEIKKKEEKIPQGKNRLLFFVSLSCAMY